MPNVRERKDFGFRERKELENVEDAKEFLVKAMYLQTEAEELEEARRMAYNAACGTGRFFSGDRVQTSYENISEKKFAEYVAYSELLAEKIREREEYCAETICMINKIDNAVFRILLTARYINCKKWEQIAEKIGYSDKWVRTALHSAALKEFGKIMKKEKRL